MIVNKKDLELLLATLKGFENPKWELEQYSTPSDVAAELLWTAFMEGNIDKKIIIDLGCGTGILTFGAALLGAEVVYGFDIDNDALKTAEQNLKIIKDTKIPIKQVIFMKKNVSDIDKKCDTVIMNPPFGIQVKKSDRPFLKKAFEIGDNIYSIHSRESGKFLKVFAKENGFEAKKINDMKMALPKTMKFHDKEKYIIEVELWKFFKG